ncbi:MAG: hypothetical protein EOO68_17695 [Moraxellaceae bacterium]|nr:MAG: hypothetical protein EOO68_17695 [Moraxellaceae bacterium]
MLLPLCQRHPDDWIADCTTPLAALGNQVGRWRCEDFLGHVTRLAEHLPDHKCVINLCENRYLFTVGFCAAILKQQTSLFPQNRTQATQKDLFDYAGDAYVLYDGHTAIAPGLDHVNVNSLNLLGEPCRTIPQIDAEFLAAIAFTSGSTGQPKANMKPWRTLFESSRINARLILGDNAKPYSALATVPAQHMWGLETSVLLSLFGNLCIVDSKLLFPMDIRNALAELPEPRLLISTPIHLRALVLSGVTMPTVARILCATAPLSSGLAIEIETLFHGELIEIFGCSEVGSMACRRTAQQTSWRLFDGLTFTPLADASGHEVSASHLPGSQLLSDKIEWINAQEFHLLGRGDDMIEIAGKRGSIQEMNKLLLALSGVVDGAIFLPEQSAIEHIIRPAALVVASGLSKDAIAAHFAKYLDPVFIPRPILLVNSLPREENGKLPRAKLLAFFEQTREA